MKVKRSSFLTVNFYHLPRPEKGEERKFQELYTRLHNATVLVATYFEKLGVKSENDIIFNTFNMDLMVHGLGNEVKVVIENIPLKAGGCRHDFLGSVMKIIKNVFPRTRKVIGEVHLEKDDKETYFVMEDH